MLLLFLISLFHTCTPALPVSYYSSLPFLLCQSPLLALTLALAFCVHGQDLHNLIRVAQMSMQEGLYIGAQANEMCAHY